MNDTAVIIERRAVAPFYKNGYIVACSSTKAAACFDPGDEARELLECIDRHALKLTYVLLTHGHMDHICGVREIKDRWNVPIYIHREDQFLYDSLTEQGQWFGLSYAAAPPVDHHLEEDSDIPLGDLQMRVYHTPGHSPGGVTFEVKEHLFCGDLIFAGGVGRSDLPGGSHEILLNTIHQKILPLGDSKILHPGHGPDSTVGKERKTNPFLTGEI